MRGICCQCQSECDCERIIGGTIICSQHEAFGSHCEGSGTFPQVILPPDESPLIDLHTFPDIEEAERDEAWGLGRKH